MELVKQCCEEFDGWLEYDDEKGFFVTAMTGFMTHLKYCPYCGIKLTK